MRTVRRLVARYQVASGRAVREFVEDRGHRHAAQIGFFALLSAVPLGLLLVAGFGLLFEDADVRERVVTTVFENVPLSNEEDRDRLEATVVDALDNAGSLHLFPVLLLLAAATGVMGALRHAINEAWDIDKRPPIVKRKALDLALVLVATLVLGLSLSLTATRRAAQILGDEENGGWAAALLLDSLGDLLPFVFTALTIMLLYRVLPMMRPRLRDVWAGAVVASLLITAVRGVLELYFEQFADLGAIYGSLGALMALLLFVFCAANAVVFGAEFASEYARLPRDDEVARIAREERGKAKRWLMRRA